MAWECHPDRAELTGRGPSDMNELFININIAYERLSGHIKKAGFTHPSPHLPESMSIGRQKSGQGYDSWKGTLPDCKLFIGQYLYYSDLLGRFCGSPGVAAKPQTGFRQACKDVELSVREGLA